MALSCRFGKSEASHRIVEPPFQPYSYSLRPVQNGVPVKKILLSDLRVHTVYKVEYPDETRQQMGRTAWTTEDHMPFKMRIATNLGYKFPSKQPKMLAWDIETKLAGLNPDPLKDEIVSIATWGEDPADRRFFNGDRRKFIPELVLKQTRSKISSHTITPLNQQLPTAWNPL